MDEQKIDKQISSLLDLAQTPVTTDWGQRVLEVLEAPPSPRRLSRRLAFGIAGGIALLGGLLLLLVIFRHPGNSPKSMATTPKTTTDKSVVRVHPPKPDEEKVAASFEKQDRKIVRAVANPLSAKELFAVIAAQGEASDGSGRKLKVGDRIPAGATVRTGKNGGVSFITIQGSEFGLDRGSELSLAKDAKNAFLRSGRLYCRNRHHEFQVITTEAGKIELLGTVIDAKVKSASQVAVTVVEGRVRLENRHGEVLVSAGQKALLSTGSAPEPGEAANSLEETAWYDGRGGLVSDYGDIIYALRGLEDDGPLTEVWAMGENGEDKHLVKTYLGAVWLTGPWLPWERSLLISPGGLCWTYPDMRQRRGNGWEGVALLGLSPRWWLLNTETGQDSLLDLPEDSGPIYSLKPSPEGTKLAFWASGNGESPEGGCGIYIYDLWSGRLNRLIQAAGYGEIAWSPEGGRIAAEVFISPEHFEQLTLIDAVTGEGGDLHFQARDPVFSPEGKRIAFVGDFFPDSSHNQGSVFLLDLQPGAELRRMTPAGENAQYPQWSPQGNRLLYWVWHIPDDNGMTETSVRVIDIDGSERREIYYGVVKASAWSRDSKAIYISTPEGVLLVSADGAGVIANLGGNSKDSGFSARGQGELKLARRTVQEAMFQYSMGQWLAYEGRMAESRAAFTRSAELFAGLPYRFPRLHFSVSNVLLYADKAAALAARPEAEVQEETCRVHLTHLGALIRHYQEQHDNQAPASLEELAGWAKALDNIALDGWLIPSKADLMPMFRCPEGDSYIYTPLIGRQPQAGEALLSCPKHSDNILRWESDGKQWYPGTLSYYTESGWGH